MFKKIKNSFIVLLASIVLIGTLFGVFMGVMKIDLSRSLEIPTWEVAGEDGNFVNSENHYSYFAFKFDNLNSEKLNVKSVWFNLSDLNDRSELNIHVSSVASTTSSSSAAYGFAKSSVNVTDVKDGDWLCMATNYRAQTVGKGPYIIVAVKESVTINEVAFVGIEDDGDLVKLTPTAIEYAGAVVEDSLTTPLTGNSSKRVPSKSLLENSVHLLDDQNSFDISKVERQVISADTNNDKYSKMNDKESHSYVGEGIDTNWLIQKNQIFMQETIGIKYSGERGIVWSESNNILASELIALGVIMFGENTFALYFMPMLFAIGAVVFMFFLLKKYLKDDILRACLLGGFAMMLTAITLALGVISAPMTALFIVGALYFIGEYLIKGYSYKNNTKTVLFVALSGVFIWLAVLCKITAMIFVPFMLAGIVWRIIKDAKKAKAFFEMKGKKVSYACISDVVISAVIGFVFAPIILALASNIILGNLLMTTYAVDNIILIPFKRFPIMFTHWL